MILSNFSILFWCSFCLPCSKIELAWFWNWPTRLFSKLGLMEFSRQISAWDLPPLRYWMTKLALNWLVYFLLLIYGLILTNQTLFNQPFYLLGSCPNYGVQSKMAPRRKAKTTAADATYWLLLAYSWFAEKRLRLLRVKMFFIFWRHSNPQDYECPYFQGRENNSGFTAWEMGLNGVR